MNSFRILLLAMTLAITPVARSSDAPRHFDVLTKERYVLVILHENGKAEYLHRETRPDGTLWFFHDPASTWGYFPDMPKNTRPNIWVKTLRGRFDYHLEEERLTEIDKMGVRNVLTKRKNDLPESK